MVAAILRLRPFTTAARSVPEAVRSPFDFLWKTPAVEAVTYGPELLPAVDFGVKAAPWQVQAWNGKGSGEADRAVTRGGRASMRVDIPAGESQQAATVLVWPSWGDGKLDIALHAGREYEMSAYIKLQGRNVPPELKISLPEGAAGTTRSGEDPADAEGWRRIWLRAGVTERAVPSYLAVWVQGPGTVWVSDLSLKEVVPPPIEVSVDQPDYDSSDRAATASVTIAAGVAPAQVRFTLARIGGSAAGVMTVPFESHPVIRSGGAGGNALQLTGSASLNNSQVTFDPSILAPGEYQFEVELLDTQGKGIASQSIMFRRDGG